MIFLDVSYFPMIFLNVKYVVDWITTTISRATNILKCLSSIKFSTSQEKAQEIKKKKASDGEN